MQTTSAPPRPAARPVPPPYRDVAWARPDDHGGSPPPPVDPPPSPHPTPSAPSRLPATGRVLAMAAAFGVAFDIGVRSRPASIGVSFVLVAAALVVLFSGRVRNRQSLLLLALSLPFVVFLSLRTSSWIVPIDLLVALVLILGAASYARGGSVVSVTGSGAFVRFGRGLVSVIYAPSYLLAAIAATLPARSDRRRRAYVAIGRGVGIAAPLLIVVGLLLASSDAVFGSLFQVPLDAGQSTTHLLVFGLGVMIGAYLLTEVSSDDVGDFAIEREPLGATEACVVLGGLALLYGAFVVVQLVVANRGEEYVKATAGVTYAEYARQGFFQLLAVAALTIVTLLVLRMITQRDGEKERIVFVALGELVVLLSLAIVAVAINRLGLYDQAYGWTMLRFASTWVAWWLGLVFLIVGVAFAGVGGSRHWLGFALVISALVTLVGWNAADPEVVVAQRNVERAIAGKRFDAAYLVGLSDDAVPTLVGALPDLRPEERSLVLDKVCGLSRRSWREVPPTPAQLEAEHQGLSFNDASAEADAARKAACPR